GFGSRPREQTRQGFIPDKTAEKRACDRSTRTSRRALIQNSGYSQQTTTQLENMRLDVTQVYESCVIV
ncbi:hypothetical protein RB213_008206, partial [Colletotrichum asianum]